MRRVAFIFSRAPHGSVGGREGLDAVLATSTLTDELGLFFIADGVLQLLPNQQPKEILARDYIATFGVLPLYNITEYYICAVSLQQRGLSENKAWVIDAKILQPQELRRTLAAYDTILSF